MKGSDFLQIILGYCNDLENKIEKTFHEDVTIECKFKESSSVINPSIYISKPANIFSKKYNYAAIPELNRFYFIKDIVLKENHTIQLDLNVDVLYSYKDSILNSKFYIERSSAHGNVELHDSLIPITSNRIVEIGTPFADFFTSKLHNYITVVGGSSTE